MSGKVEEFLMTTFNESITYSALAHLYVARGAVLCLPWWSWPGCGGWYLPEDQSVNRKFALYCWHCEFYDTMPTWNSGNHKHRELTDLVFSGPLPVVVATIKQRRRSCLWCVWTLLRNSFAQTRQTRSLWNLSTGKRKSQFPKQSVRLRTARGWPRLYVAQQWQC